jgi:hypothetical protein
MGFIPLLISACFLIVAASAAMVFSCVAALTFKDAPVSKSWLLVISAGSVVYLASLILILGLFVAEMINGFKPGNPLLYVVVLPPAICLILFRRPRLMAGMIGGSLVAAAACSIAAVLFFMATDTQDSSQYDGSLFPVAVVFSLFGYVLGPGAGLPVAVALSWFISFRRLNRDAPRPASKSLSE